MKRIRGVLADLRASTYAPLIGLLILALAAGLLAADDYGMGADEHANAEVGGEAIRAYTSVEAYRTFLELDNLGHHGPSYFMLFSLISERLTSILPGWQPADGRHFSNYLTFLLAGASLYVLCMRLLPKNVALMTAAIFLTQPLLFGHGFINQKDTPFMAFFLTTVVVGLAAIDRLNGASAGSKIEAEPGLWGRAREDLRSGQLGWQVLFGVWLVGILWVALDLLFFGRLLAAMESVVSLAHVGQAWEPINRLYEIVAEDSDKTSVSVYLAKLELGYWVVGRVAILLAGLTAGVLVARRAIPGTVRLLLPGMWQDYVLLMIAGALQGFTISIRPLAGFTGVLLTAVLFYRFRSRAVGPVLVFWTAASLTAYLTWPWLWPAPVDRLVESARYLVDFDEQKLVLFRGALYPSEAMPWDYLPRLMTIQLTEPVIPLFAIGLVASAIEIRRHPGKREDLLLILVWLLVIAAAYMSPGSVHYNNFRHVLFLLPPLFVVFGLGLKVLLDAIRPRSITFLVLLALLVPGILGIARLHPYEYAYYNAYAGGTSGANGIYHMDYWCLSLRRAQEYVNRVAPPGAIVFARRSIYSAIEYARPDLTMASQEEYRDGASYVLVCKHYPEDAMTRRAKLVFTEGIGPAVFAEVWRAEPQPEPSP